MFLKLMAFIQRDVSWKKAEQS